MASPDVALRLDQPTRIQFAHSPAKASIFALMSFGFTWLCWTFIRDDEVARYGFTAFSLLFVLVGAIGVFWRMELDIDLSLRRVRMLKGIWPAPKTRARALDEADGLWLRMEYRSSGSKGNKRKSPWWFVSLEFPDEKKGTRLFATRNEAEGYDKWEYYAKRLRIDAVDATADKVHRTPWKRLDDNLAAQSKHADSGPVRAPTQPTGSTVAVRSNRGHKEYVLPATGYNGGLVFLALFGGAFAAMGVGSLLASLGLIDMQVHGSEWSIRIIPPVFVLAGLGIIWLGVKGSYSATVIGVDGTALFSEVLAFGRRSGRKSVQLADIESVSVGGDVRSRHRTGGFVRIGGVEVGRQHYREREREVVVRSDGKILRFGGSLTDEEKAWLADACQYATLRGQLP